MIYNVDEKENKYVGHSPIIRNSNIIFKGKNNVLYCEENVILENSNIEFSGDNSLIYLGAGIHQLDIYIYNNSVCHCGRYNLYAKTLKILVSEQKHCYIGDSCMFSVDVVIRNTDGHLIYDCETGKRICLPKSVFVGDHVWVGMYVRFLKDTRIDSGSIIGADSVVAGKKIPHNTIWAGSPSKQIKQGVFWDKELTHEIDTELCVDYEIYLRELRTDECHSDYWIYEYNSDEEISWEYLEEKMSTGTAMEKCQFLSELNSKKTKNRFVHSNFEHKK